MTSTAISFFKGSLILCWWVFVFFTLDIQYLIHAPLIIDTDNNLRYFDFFLKFKEENRTGSVAEYVTLN
jgi:hypothetical protein